MPEWLIFIFILFIIYLAMKKPTSTTEKTVTKVKAEKPAATAVAGVKPKKSAPAQKAAKKEPTAVKPKPEPASSALPVSERVGLTAGSIWRYLSESGATPVTKLVKDLPEEEKIIQRSIGWLAQEGKITLNISDRIETIALK